MSIEKVNEIHTKRLILRRFSKDDLDNYYNILKQEQVNKWLGTGKRKSYDDVKNMIERIENSWIENDYGVYAVINKENNELIGHCGLNNIDNAKDVELLYAFDPASWGNGYATESAKAVIEFAKTKTDLKKLIAIAYPDNRKSRNVIEKAGFQYKGIQEYFGANLSYYELDLYK